MTLIAGAADEVAWQFQKAEKCAGHLLPHPGSEWKPTDNDEQVYGIRATGATSSYIVLISMEDKREQIPDVGPSLILPSKCDNCCFLIKSPRGDNVLGSWGTF